MTGTPDEPRWWEYALAFLMMLAVIGFLCVGFCWLSDFWLRLIRLAYP